MSTPELPTNDKSKRKHVQCTPFLSPKPSSSIIPFKVFKFSVPFLEDFFCVLRFSASTFCNTYVLLKSCWIFALIHIYYNFRLISSQTHGCFINNRRQPIPTAISLEQKSVTAPNLLTVPNAFRIQQYSIRACAKQAPPSSSGLITMHEYDHSVIIKGMQVLTTQLYLLRVINSQV